MATQDREVMVDIMYINDLSTERRESKEPSTIRNGSAKNGIAKAKVNYHQELDLLSSHKKGEGSTRFSN